MSSLLRRAGGSTIGPCLAGASPVRSRSRRFICRVPIRVAAPRAAAMRLTEYLKPENIKLPLAATEKTAAIEELIDLLHAHGEIRDVEKVRKAVLEREATRSTGIGDGLAIPHGKTEGVDDLVMAIGRASDPIEFGSIDGKP